MPELHDLLERRASRYEPPPDLFDRVLDRRRRRDRNRRVGTAVVALAVAAAAIGGLVRTFSSGLVPAGDPRSPFVGTWVTTDLDSTTQTMVIRALGDKAMEIVVRNDSASVCAGGPSTMMGTGRLQGTTELVIPSPVLTCDDGSEPQARSGPPLEEQLRNLTFVHDPGAHALTDNFGLVWERKDREPTPSPAPGVLRTNGDVLSFTGVPFEAPGDLVAVNPQTGEERVLVEGLDLVYSARWSADGRWVAYETSAPGGDRGLWVVGPSQEPRQVATGENPNLIAGVGLSWLWSSTGAQIATINDSTLSTIDPATGETTDLGSISEFVGVGTSAPAWSPDGTRFVFGARGGALYSVDVRSGERSLLVRLPGEDLDSVDEVLWSSDGAHIAVMNDLEPGGGRLYVMNGDGSNVRVLVDDFETAGLAWSPDGTRLAYADWAGTDRKVWIWLAPMDGSAPAEIGSLVASCRFAYKCDLTWSPDGSRIAFKTESGVPEAGQGGDVLSAIDADGQGEAERIDELTYRSWDSGWYSCECT